MTDKELRKLTRRELLELLLVQSKRVEQLEAEVNDLKTQLNCRKLDLTEAGSIADAALKLNHVFEAAQAAAEQYLENIRGLSENQQQMLAQNETRCTEIETDARFESQELLQ